MTRRRYDKDFKKIVKIYNQGNHTYRGLTDEYGVTAPTVRTWGLRYNNSNSFDVECNSTEEEEELIVLRRK